MERNQDNEFMATSLRLAAYTALVVLSALVIHHDAGLFIDDRKFTENSFTEWLQVTFISASALLFYFTGNRHAPLRPVAHLLAGGFLVILIREMDGYLDAIYHGAWLPFALVALFITLFITYRHRQKLRESISLFMSTPAFGYFVAGGLGIFVFSRLFGYKGVWKDIFEVEKLDPFGPQKWVKSAVEEGSELFGYCLVFCAVIELMAYARRRLGSANA